MNDLTAVVATLSKGIASLQSREPNLSPFEKLKLKTLRVNLEAARLAAGHCNHSTQREQTRPA